MEQTNNTQVTIKLTRSEARELLRLVDLFADKCMDKANGPLRGTTAGDYWHDRMLESHNLFSKLSKAYNG